jgi:hypothetical protein
MSEWHMCAHDSGPLTSNTVSVTRGLRVSGMSSYSLYAAHW